MLPGVEPTGKHVRVALVVIVHFRNGKLAHEHIYWDQASVLAQLGLIDSQTLPVAGVESAEKVLNPWSEESVKSPANTWRSSAAPRSRHARILRRADRYPDRRGHLSGHEPGVGAHWAERHSRLSRSHARDSRDRRFLTPRIFQRHSAASRAASICTSRARERLSSRVRRRVAQDHFLHRRGRVSRERDGGLLDRVERQSHRRRTISTAARLAALVVFYLIHVIGIRWFGRVAGGDVGAEMFGVARADRARSVRARAENYTPFFTHGWSGFGASLLPLFFAYAGFESIAQTAGEVKDSTRRLPSIL